MDREEYRIKLEEIQKLAESGNFHAAAQAADGVDWKHVKSVRTLCMIAEIYETDRRYEDAVRVLKFAYKRASISKTVLYRLTLLSIRTGAVSEAKQYCREFEEISPHDSSNYILRYRILKAEGAPIDERIRVLQEYKEKEYTERWAYELARLYRKNGQTDKCIEECDDMILWFSEGKYVYKAMELKMQLTPLTPAQQQKYDSRFTYLAQKADFSATAPLPDAAALGIGETEGQADGTSGANGVSGSNDGSREIGGDAAAAPDYASSTVGSDTMPENAAELRQEFSAENRENVQERLADSIRAVFSGMIPVEKEEKDAAPTGMTGELLMPAGDAQDDLGAYRVPSLERETADGVEAARQTEEEEYQMTMDDFAPSEQSEEADLERLLAETKNEFASEVASGAFRMTDEPFLEEETPVTPEEHTAEEKEAEEPAEVVEEITEEEPSEAVTEIPEEESVEAPAELTEEELSEAAVELTEEAPVEETEEFAEESETEAVEAIEEESKAEAVEAIEEESEAAPAEPAIDPLYDKETDESLGLTREFNFSEELKKAMGRGESLSEAAQHVSLMAEATPVAEAAQVPVPEELKEEFGMTEPEDYSDALLVPSAGKFAEAIAVFSANSAAEKAVASGLSAEGEEILPDADEQTDTKMLSDTEELPDEVPEDIPEELFATEEDRAANSAQDAEEAAEAAAAEDLSADFTEEGSVAKESRSIIEDIMQRPEVLHKVPVEPRRLDETEKKIFSYFSPIPGMGEQITETIADVHNNAGDKTSRSGNILLIGRQGSGKTHLADSLILSICRDLNIKGARIAHIVATDFNRKDPAQVVTKLAGGFLVIEGAGSLSENAVEKLLQAMEFRTEGLVVMLEDEKGDLLDLVRRHPDIRDKFTSNITIPVFTNDELVTFAKTYAKECGYKMDELAVLALYTKIGNNQKDSEPVTIGKVKEILDSAIAQAERGSRRFGRKLSKKNVYSDGRIMLLEKDFQD